MPTIFVSYSHKDEAWKERVVEQLGVLGQLEVWDDRRIAAGEAWRAEIDAALGRCDVAVLLVSSALLTSRFIVDVEVAALVRGAARLVPVIVRDCAWDRVEWLNGIQARPRDGKPLAGMTDPDAALAALAREIDDLLGPRSSTADEPLPPRRNELDRLPQGTDVFVGRDAELDLLDAAWAEACNVLQIVAPGGIGKTALVQRWLDRMQAGQYRGARMVYGWSF